MSTKSRHTCTQMNASDALGAHDGKRSCSPLPFGQDQCCLPGPMFGIALVHDCTSWLVYCALESDQSSSVPVRQLAPSHVCALRGVSICPSAFSRRHQLPAAMAAAGSHEHMLLVKPCHWQQPDKQFLPGRLTVLESMLRWEPSDSGATQGLTIMVSTITGKKHVCCPLRHAASTWPQTRQGLAGFLQLRPLRLTPFLCASAASKRATPKEGSKAQVRPLLQLVAGAVGYVFLFASFADRDELSSLVNQLQRAPAADLPPIEVRTKALQEDRCVKHAVVPCTVVTGTAQERLPDPRGCPSQLLPVPALDQKPLPSDRTSRNSLPLLLLLAAAAAT